MRVRLVVIAAITLAVCAAEVVIEVRVLAPLPRPVTSIAVPRQFVPVAGSPPRVDPPATGSLALLTDAGETLAAADADTVRPIGSVAKTMTALLVLKAHPLPTSAAGPVLTLTADDVRDYEQEIASGGSAVPVREGETLSERDLLLALLLPSANNIADTLARWVSGSLSGFITAANAQATALDMMRTHFDDASGVSAHTVSTASDLVILARTALAQPAFAELVRTQTATLSDGTVVHNLDIALSTGPDWLGVKTGWTPAAGGCLLFAARHSYATSVPPVTVYGAVLGQPPDATVDPAHPELGQAFAVAQRSVATADRGYAAVDLTATTPTVRGELTEPWGARTSVHARPAGGVILVHLGEALTLRTIAGPATAATPAGAVVATIEASLRGHAEVSWPVVTDRALDPPGFWWRLSR